jgi:hypothetical protein
VNILYYTGGLSGSGHVVQGISIFNALRRRGSEAAYTILSSNPAFTGLADRMGVTHCEVPFEDEGRLSQTTFASSALYTTILSVRPDVLIVDLFWFPLFHFIRELPCRKIFLCRQVADNFFSVRTAEETLIFRPEDYDLTLATEPFQTYAPLTRIDPLVIRNRDEIMSREDVERALHLGGNAPRCLFAFSGKPEVLARAKEEHARSVSGGYEIVYSTDYEGGIFPAVDYFNAFDILVCGAGYNAFWEAVYFGKRAEFVPQKVRFEDQARRVEECRGYSFERNGADRLVDLIMEL